MKKYTVNYDYANNHGCDFDSYVRDVEVYECNGLVMVVIYNYDRDGIRSISINGDLTWCHLEVDVQDVNPEGLPIIRAVLDEDLKLLTTDEIDGVVQALDEMNEAKCTFEGVLSHLYNAD